MLAAVKLEHKLAVIAGSFAAPGFGQAVAGRRRAALVWCGLEVTFTLLATRWVGFPLLATALRFVAAFVTAVQLRRRDDVQTWWHRLSIAVFIAGIGAFAVLRGTVQAFKIPSSSMYPTLMIGDHIFVDKLSSLWRTPERGDVVVFHMPCQPDRDFVKRVIGLAGDTVEVRCNVVYVNGAAIANELQDASATYRDYDEMEGKWYTRATSRYREHHGEHTYEVFHDPERPERDKHAATLEAGDSRDFPQRDRMFAPSCTASDFYEQKPARVAQPAGKLVVTKPSAQACEQQAHFVVPAGGLFVMGDNRNNANDSRYWGVVPIDAVIGRAMGIWGSRAKGEAPSLSRFGSID